MILMSNTPLTTIRLSITKEVRDALCIAKKRYPALSDPEILKLGLSRIVTEPRTEVTFEKERDEIRKGAASAVGTDYLDHHDEDGYTASLGKKVHFS